MWRFIRLWRCWPMKTIHIYRIYMDVYVLYHPLCGFVIAFILWNGELRLICILYTLDNVISPYIYSILPAKHPFCVSPSTPQHIVVPSLTCPMRRREMIENCEQSKNVRRGNRGRKRKATKRRPSKWTTSYEHSFIWRCGRKTTFSHIPHLYIIYNNTIHIQYTHTRSYIIYVAHYLSHREKLWKEIMDERLFILHFSCSTHPNWAHAFVPFKWFEHSSLWRSAVIYRCIKLPFFPLQSSILVFVGGGGEGAVDVSGHSIQCVPRMCLDVDIWMGKSLYTILASCNVICITKWSNFYRKQVDLLVRWET